MFLTIDVLGNRSYFQSIFLAIDVLELDFFVVDVLELDVLGVRRFIINWKCIKWWKILNLVEAKCLSV